MDGSQFVVQLHAFKDGKVYGSSAAFEGVKAFSMDQLISIDFFQAIYEN